MRIFLIGFMGSGKTTLGKQLARKLDYQFIDQDTFIEQQTGISVADYFTKFGEAAFRKLEHESFIELIKLQNAVISTGGGAPCFFNNIGIMNENGIAIYLRMSPEVLKSRLKYAQNERPLIKGKSESELLDFIKLKLAEREPFYMQAHHVIESMDLKSDDLLQLINYHKKN
jgi:shikimate kinase